MSSASPVHAPSYLTVLRLPQAARTFGAALVARLAYGIVFLALVLTVEHATGSYAVAGGVLAVFGLASSLLAPYRARLIDQHGVHRALLPMAAACAALLGLIAAVAWQPGAPGAALWVLGTAAGACAPPLGPFMRTLWRDLVPDDDEQLLQRAYSLDTVAEELLYVVGPLLAGVLTALAEPALGVALSAVLLFGGTAVLAGSPVAASFRGSAAPQPDTGGEQGAAPPRRDARWWTSLADPVLATAGLGACMGAFNPPGRRLRGPARRRCLRVLGVGGAGGQQRAGRAALRRGALAAVHTHPAADSGRFSRSSLCAVRPGHWNGRAGCAGRCRWVSDGAGADHGLSDCRRSGFPGPQYGGRYLGEYRLQHGKFRGVGRDRPAAVSPLFGLVFRCDRSRCAASRSRHGPVSDCSKTSRKCAG